MKNQKNFECQEGVEFFTVPQKGHPSMVSDELVTEMKAILHMLHASGEVISRKTVIAIGNGILSSRCPEKWTKNGGSVTLTTIWVWEILKSLDWVKRRGTTAKTEMNLALHEHSLGRQKLLMLFSNSIRNEMILNFD